MDEDRISQASGAASAVVVRGDVGIGDIDAAEWNALVGGAPLVSHAFLSALHELQAIDNRLEYAKTALKYGTMILQKASDGLRERDELRDGVNKLNEALEVFRDYDLAEQMSETEYLINALERTAIGY